MAKSRIIYDVGSNNGDDIPYYLMKADVVVAIEANPVLCEVISQRFAAEIQAGRVILKNLVVTASKTSGEVDFYVHNTNHVLSQFPKPPDANLDEYTCRKLPSQSIIDLVKENGDPYYIKIDIEHYDVELLRAIFDNQIYPPFISAECHTVEVFTVLVERGGYSAFKLVDGRSVSQVYVDRMIRSDATGKSHRYSFPFHSAGPFGHDVDGPWMAPDHFIELLAFGGFGWKDIHATNVENQDPTAQPRVVDYLDRLASLDELISYVFRRSIHTFIGGVKTRFPICRWRRPKP